MLRCRDWWLKKRPEATGPFTDVSSVSEKGVDDASCLAQSPGELVMLVDVGLPT